MEKKQKVLIELPVETYEYWKEHPYEYVLAEAIKNGIPLSNSEADEQIAKERFSDLCDFFKDEKVKKSILYDRENFKKWLNNMTENVKRVDELCDETDYLKAEIKELEEKLKKKKIEVKANTKQDAIEEVFEENSKMVEYSISKDKLRPYTIPLQNQPLNYYIALMFSQMEEKCFWSYNTYFKDIFNTKFFTDGKRIIRAGIVATDVYIDKTKKQKKYIEKFKEYFNPLPSSIEVKIDKQKLVDKILNSDKNAYNISINGKIHSFNKKFLLEAILCTGNNVGIVGPDNEDYIIFYDKREPIGKTAVSILPMTYENIPLADQRIEY